MFQKILELFVFSSFVDAPLESPEPTLLECFVGVGVEFDALDFSDQLH